MYKELIWSLIVSIFSPKYIFLSVAKELIEEWDPLLVNFNNQDCRTLLNSIFHLVWTQAEWQEVLSIKLQLALVVVLTSLGRRYLPASTKSQAFEKLAVARQNVSFSRAKVARENLLDKVASCISGAVPDQLNCCIPGIKYLAGSCSWQVPQHAAIETWAVHFQCMQHLNWGGKVEGLADFHWFVNEFSSF